MTPFLRMGLSGSLAILVMLLVVSAPAAYAKPCNDGVGHPNKGKNFIMDLSSAQDLIRAPNQFFKKAGVDEALINVGGSNVVVRPNDMISPAEFVALKQVLLNGTQTIDLDAAGRAIGGHFDLYQVMHPGKFASLVIPDGVAGILPTNRPVFNITRLLQTDGILLGIPGTKDVPLTIRTGTVNVGIEGMLTTIVPPELQSIVGNITTPLDLRLFTDCACNNAGQITASGSLLIDSRTAINNASTGLISGWAGVTLFSREGVFNNAGTISAGCTTCSPAVAGNVTFNTVPGRDMVLNNLGGTISALLGTINLRLPNYSASALTEVTGGVLEALALNINGGNGPLVIDVQRIGAIDPALREQGVIGTVQGRAGSADVTVSEGTLDVGTLTTSRGGITLTNTEDTAAASGLSSGSIAINSADSSTHLLAALAVGDVRIQGLNSGEITTDITLGDSTSISAAGGNIIALASGNIAGGTGITLTATAAKTKDNQPVTTGGIHLGAGLTDIVNNGDLVDLIGNRPPTLTIPDGTTLAAIGATVDSHGINRGVLKLVPTDGTNIHLNASGNTSTINLFGGVVLLEAAGGKSITMDGSTFNSTIPVGYTSTAEPIRSADSEFVVDTGADDPGMMEDEVVAAQ
jgi:hypothetical protein